MKKQVLEQDATTIFVIFRSGDMKITAIIKIPANKLENIKNIFRLNNLSNNIEINVPGMRNSPEIATLVCTSPLMRPIY